MISCPYILFYFSILLYFISDTCGGDYGVSSQPCSSSSSTTTTTTTTNCRQNSSSSSTSSKLCIITYGEGVIEAFKARKLYYQNSFTTTTTTTTTTHVNSEIHIIDVP